MASQIWVPGPCELHVGVGAAGALVHLGWSVEGLRIRLLRKFRDIRIDLAGDQAFDSQLRGLEAMIIGDLVAWDEAVLRACQSTANPSALTPGVLPAGSIGGLMVSEASAYRLLLYPQYINKPVYAGQTIYNFLRGWLAGPDEIGPVGTKEKRTRVMFRAIPVYSPVDGSFTLWNEDATGKGPAV